MAFMGQAERLSMRLGAVLALPGLLSASMNADRVRELVARREGLRLDFKRPEFANKTSAAKLAKHVMAMANALRSGDEPGYILVGVEEVKPEGTGRIVGIADQDCEDDAHVQQRVGSLLNRTPSFSFEVVVVDDKPVGVFTIHPGGRPYFPKKDSGDGSSDRKVLLHHVALVRRGSSTEVASPTEIIEWHREDFGEAVEAVQIASIRQLSHRMELAAGDPPRQGELLDELGGYTREGVHVRHEVLRGLHAIVSSAPLNAGVAARTTSIASNALELGPCSWKAAIGVDPAELPLLEVATQIAGQIAYDAVKVEFDPVVLDAGARLLWELLRVAHLNDLGDLKAKVLEGFSLAIDLAGRFGVDAAATVLRQQRDDALDIASTPVEPTA